MANNNSDTAWKEILDNYLKDFFDYCLPQVSDLIDWDRKYVTLDKELQKIIKGAITGKRILDKLFKVFLKNGDEQWVLIHIEIQNQDDFDFAKRMFTYSYRIYDKYQQPIISCAVLTDEQKNWRPNQYEIGLAGSYLKSEFLVIKILDYIDQIDELEKSNHLFACLIYSQLKAIENKYKPHEERKRIKFSLTKRLYEKGFAKNDIINLYKFIDWLIGLPTNLELEYNHEVHYLEESKKMAYVSSMERYGLAKGLEQGLAQGKLEGKLEGFAEASIKFAQRLLAEKCTINFVAKMTDLSEEQIKNLQTEVTTV